MRLVPLAAVLVIGAAFASSVAGAAEDGPILPGWWESTSKVLSPLPSSKTEDKCIPAKIINSYLTGPSNPHYTCHYDSRHLEGGHAVLEGECVDNNGLHSKVKVEGDYSATSFNLRGHLHVVIGMLPIPVETSVEAHRLAAICPVGAKVEGGGPAPGEGQDSGG